MTDKAAIRRQMRARRDAMTDIARAEKSAVVCRLAASLIAPGSAVLAYAAVRSELDVWPLIRRLWALRCAVCLPVTGTDGHMEAARILPEDELVSDRFGIPAPARPRIVPPEALQFALTPGLAFDAHGDRLGYGAGFFDRYLARTDCLRVGVAFSEQIVPSVPAQPWDLPMDVVLTDAGVLLPASGECRLRQRAPEFCEISDKFSWNRAEF